jgi:hypothetical protein
MSVSHLSFIAEKPVGGPCHARRMLMPRIGMGQS